MLTNAQLQARIEALENTLRVIVNQDVSRIQPVGTVAAAGYAEGNGRVAASNHVHAGGGVSEPVMVADFNGSMSSDAIVSVVMQADVNSGDYLQGFAFCTDESVAATLTFSDSKGNTYTSESPIGIVGSEVSPVESAGGASTWVVPFGAHIYTPLTVADAD